MFILSLYLVWNYNVWMSDEVRLVPYFIFALNAIPQHLIWSHSIEVLTTWLCTIIQNGKAHGPNGGTLVLWDVVRWREPPAEMNHAVCPASDQLPWRSPTSSNRSRCYSKNKTSQYWSHSLKVDCPLGQSAKANKYSCFWHLNIFCFINISY